MNAPERAGRRCAVCHATYTGGERFCPLDGGVIAADAATDPLVGTVIDNRYAIIRLLGSGGMGTVYEAEHVGLGKRVALKLGPEGDANRDQRMRFRREARAASNVVNPHVVQIFDVTTDATGRDVIAMEYIAGRDLEELIHDGPLPAGRAIAIAPQILDGLRACHDAGIVHRDIKPGNIRLVDGSGAVKIMDFGIAKPLDAATGTRTGEVIGTPQYMAPEQLGDGAVDHRADLYAVGATLFAMLAGAAPFADTGFTARVATEAGARPAPSLTELRPGLPPSLLAVVTRALQRSPSDRYQSAAEFADALRTCAADADAKAGAPTRSLAPAPRRRFPRWIWAIPAAAAAAAAAALLLAHLGTTDDPPVRPAVTPAPAPAPAVIVDASPPQPIAIDASPPDAPPAPPPRTRHAPAQKQPIGPVCLCKVKTPSGSISTACIRKAAQPHCTCKTSSHARLCPYPITVTNDGNTVRLPDGTRGGQMWCLDRSHADCDPLVPKLPVYCNAAERPAKQSEPCRGYTTGQVEGDEMLAGTYSCGVCDRSPDAPRFHGQNGDPCTGFEVTTGERASGVLYDCRIPTEP